MATMAPFSFWLRNDVKECMRKEDSMGAKINAVLAEHYKDRLESAMREMVVCRVLLACDETANDIDWLQIHEGWSRDHIVEVAIRYETGMADALNMRKVRRLCRMTKAKVKIGCITVALPQDVAQSMRAKAGEREGVIDGWISALAARRKQAAQTAS